MSNRKGYSEKFREGKYTIGPIECDCIIGVLPDERVNKQLIRLTFEYKSVITKAVQSDSLETLIDYAELVKTVHHFTETSQFQLIETLANELCTHLFNEFPSLAKIKLKLEKPHPFNEKPNITLELKRYKPKQSAETATTH